MTMTARPTAIALISILAMTLPQQVQAGSSLRIADKPSFEAYLPRIEEVPWLRIKATALKPRYQHLPEAGSVSALLFTPTPAPAWPRQFTQSAEVTGTSVGM